MSEYQTAAETHQDKSIKNHSKARPMATFTDCGKKMRLPRNAQLFPKKTAHENTMEKRVMAAATRRREGVLPISSSTAPDVNSASTPRRKRAQ
jgi:hypothetical protein